MMFRSVHAILRLLRAGPVPARCAGLFLCCSLLASALQAQGIVSPRGWESTVGNQTTNGVPFYSDPQWTYQQIHTDLPAGPRRFSQIAFRQGPTDFGWFSGKILPRTVEAELRIGDSDFAQRSPTFASNFVNPPTLVMARTKIDIPAFVHPPAGGYPAPFTLVLKFDAPWTWSGRHDLCWEIRVHSISLDRSRLNNPTPLDMVNTRDYAWDSGSIRGKSCVASGQSKPMTLSGEVRSYHLAAKHTFAWQVENAPAYARSTFLLGLSDPARFHQQLCTFQHVDSVFAALTVFADARGRFTSPLLEIPFDPMIFGATFHVQAYSLDNGRHPGLLPVSATYGLKHVVPSAPPRPVDLAIVTVPRLNVQVGSLHDDRGLITEFK